MFRPQRAPAGVIARFAALCAAAAVVTTVIVPAAAADPAPTPSGSTAPASPSTSASGSASPSPSVPTVDPAVVAAAQQAARQAAQKVAGLVHGVAAAQAQVRRLTSAAQQAQARFDAQTQAQAAAEQTAALAAARARDAADAYAREHENFIVLITAAYENGDNGSGTVTALDGLMTAGTPNDVLAADQDRRLLAERQSQIVAQDRLAALANEAAQLRARSAVSSARAATAQLQALRDRSRAAATQAVAALTVLRRELVAAKATQAQTDAALSGFLGGWSIADPARAAALNKLYLSQVRRVGAHAATPALEAVRRAVLFLGTPYAWAGGSAAGPTTGVCAGGGAENDCHLTGFDCSGLTLYAWAPSLALPHLASAQYTAAGRLHPVVTALQPGDLVFWSTDGTAAGIHHVALYVGAGNVVQAPQSGDIVRITPLAAVDAGYFGATRPLS